MRIVHAAPFAPNRAGIYEAARDMVRADALAGHGVEFVDVGVTVGTTREAPLIGAVDDRGGFRIVTAPPLCLDYADVIVCHTGVPDAWVVRTQAPMVWVLHGRPLAAYRLEQATGLHSYSLYAEVARWPRATRLVSFWPEHRPYWNVIIPAEKLVTLDDPPCDGERFTPDGERYVIPDQHRGAINGLIADSWREDIDIYEVVHGALEASKRLLGLRWHLYGIERQDGPWTYLLDALRRAGALGEVCSRVAGMEARYRAYDLVLTPHRIVTRTISEALCSGVPVVAAIGCAVTPYLMRPDDPASVAEAVEALVTTEPAFRRRLAREQAARFDLRPFGMAMTAIYTQAVQASAGVHA